MKLLVFAMVALVGAAFAYGPAIEGGVGGSYPGVIGTDDIIDSNAYDAGTAYSSAYANFSPDGSTDYITADDFDIAVDAQVAEVLYWFVNTDGAGQPSTADMFLYADAMPGPGTELQSSACAVVSTQTAIPWGSGWVYECMVTPATPFTFDLGTVYWIAPLRTGDNSNWYCLVGSTIRGTECYLWYNNVWQPWSSLGYPANDVFRIMYGSTTALDRGTWGSIKTLF